MASRRLTKAVKEDILNSVLNRTLGDREIAQRERKKQLAERVYQVIFSADERALLASLPEGWAPNIHTFNVAFDLDLLGDKELVEKVRDEGIRDALRIKRWVDELRLELPSCRRIPYANHYSTFKLSEEQGLEIAPAVEATLREAVAISISKRDLRNKIEALLAQCSTDKKLLEFWPEAAQYLPEELKQSPSYLPAVTAKELNDLIAVLKPVSGDAPAV